MAVSRRSITSGCAVLFIASLVASPSAWGQRVADDDAERWVLRTYDVDDLVLDVRDHPYSESLMGGESSGVGQGGRGFGGGGGGFGGGGGGFFSVPDDADPKVDRFGASGRSKARIQYAQFGGEGMQPNTFNRTESDRSSSANITIGDLERVIVTTIAAESWSANGGEGQIERLGTSLVVWQSADVHQHIIDLLEQLRKGLGNRTTLTIDARWLLLNSDELADLFTMNDGRSSIDKPVLEKYTRRPGSIRGITNCFSGQLVYVVSGTRRNIVRSYIPVVGSLESPDSGIQFASGRGHGIVQLIAEENDTSGREMYGGRGGYGGQDGGYYGGGRGGEYMGRGDSSVGYQPIVESPNFGTLLEIRPTLTRDSPTVVVDVKSTITVPAKVNREMGGERGGGYGMAPAVDRVAIETQQLATSLRITLGKPMLVGGLTYVPVGDTPQPTDELSGEAKPVEQDAERPQLYFVLEIAHAGL